MKDDTLRKLKILAESAKYDVSCSSSGTVRRNVKGGVGNTVGGIGICHSFAEDGRCISLLKVMLTNYCIYDCAYCINISYFIDGFIPGSVIGMVLLFLALAFKVVKPNKVKKLSTLLTENMGLFFLPAGVGLMNSLGIISQYWVVIVTASVVSTILVIASVALIQQKLGKETDENE